MRCVRSFDTSCFALTVCLRLCLGLGDHVLASLRSGRGVEDDLQINQKKKTMEIRGGGSEVQI